VERGQKTFNRDYASGDRQLNMEETPRERTWSVGGKIAADQVAKAFGLAAKKDLLRGGDAGPNYDASSVNAAGARLEPDSAKRRARSEYAATLRDAAGSAVLTIIH